MRCILDQRCDDEQPNDGSKSMNAEEYIQTGRLDEALAALQSEVRNQPADAKLRTFLFQLLCVLGQWERAMT